MLLRRSLPWIAICLFLIAAIPVIAQNDLDVSPHHSSRLSEEELRKLIKASSTKAGWEEADEQLSKLDSSYLPILKKLVLSMKACDGVKAANLYVDVNQKDNRGVVPELVKLTTGVSLRYLFSLEEEGCRREAAYLLPLSAEGVRELTKILNKGDRWEKETAVFAFDDFTETYSYTDSDRNVALRDTIPVLASGLRSKREVIHRMSNEVLGQIARGGTPELRDLANQYYER